ncbi:hypothetical protein KCU81_g1599, partial [Aureobasidium melanogenum]
MRLSNIFLALMAMASAVYGQSEDCYSDENDFQPGHMEDMAKLPEEIQRCIRVSIWAWAWTDVEKQLDLFCDHSTGEWHHTIPSCLQKHCPSDPSAAISQYNTFNSALCRGWEGPGLPLTTILSSSGAAFTTSTIFPTSSETRYENVLSEVTMKELPSAIAV